ncbi:MAG: SemiSWEET transporter [Flavobacteriaceae bacterium]|nr:SemiSWEET transporter [Flavobacteriaceae bacterium]
MTFNIEIVGLIAGALTTIAYLPQVRKTWKTKSVKELSLTMYLVMFVGVMLWLTYGILIHSISIILANIVTGVLTSMLIYFKLKYK